MNPAALMWGVVFGSVGLGFFVYGKRQKAIIPFISGIGLMLGPYIIANVFLLVITGLVLIALPFVIKR